MRKAIRSRPQLVVAAIAAVLLVAWMVVLAYTNTRAIQSQQLLIDKLATALDSAKAQGAEVPTPEQVAEAVPGADVSPVVGIPGERGEAGPPGSEGLQGLPGLQGDRGPGPTEAEIDLAVANFCAARDGCRGPTGPTGPTGADGQNGINGTNGTPGADGAPGADSQVPGPPGPQGPPVHTQDCTPSNALDLSQPWSCTVTS